MQKYKRTHKKKHNDKKNDVFIEMKIQSEARQRGPSSRIWEKFTTFNNHVATDQILFPNHA